LRGAPDPWISSRLVDFVGLAAAKYLLFTGAVIDAQEAASIGLVGKVVPNAEFEKTVQSTLDEVCLTAPKARAMVKDDINRRLSVPDVNMFRRAILSEEMVEGFRAFLEKRDPEWPRE
jgi:enoyl-CoA hydratase/carnithine racemase